MSGYTQEEFEIKEKEWKKQAAQTESSVATFNFKHMKNPFEGKSTDYELPEDKKVLFSNELEKNENIKKRILSQEEREEYFPKGLTSY